MLCRKPGSITFEDADEPLGDEYVAKIDGAEKVTHEDKLWYAVETQGGKAWVPEDAVSKVSAYDWPGFRIVKEGASSASLLFSRDLEVDYDALPEFFQKIVDEMDANHDGRVSRGELLSALSEKPEILKKKLSRLICVHPSEWRAATWKDLLDRLKQEGRRIGSMEGRIEKLCWWGKAESTEGFPDSVNVYHWNPVAFVSHMKLLVKRSKPYDKEYVVDHIPATSDKRPQNSLSPNYLTIHSTANPNSTATGERNYLTNPDNTSSTGYHLVVDENVAIECIPLTENAWHAGDGTNGTGNRQSIGLEIVESGDRAKTLDNAIKLAAEILIKHSLAIDKMKRHYDWTGKNCPRILLDPLENGGESHQTWDWFKEKVEDLI